MSADLPVATPDPSVDLRDLFRRLWPHRFRILAITVVAGILGVALAFVLPKWYRATAVILPPEESDLLSNMSLASRAIGKFPAFGEFGEYFTPADIYRAILRSRTIRGEVVDQFRLVQVYKAKNRENAMRTLEKLTNVKLAADGTISVSVEDRDPKRAAEMAMTMLAGLDKYNIEKRNTQARRTRMFLETRLAETDSILRSNEIALRRYQEEHHAVVPTSMNSADVSSAADLVSRRMLLEVRLGVLRGYLRDDNEQVIQLREELRQLKNQIGSLPGLQTDLARMLRDTKVQEQLYVLLNAELEQARIEELKNTPTVQVLDVADPPDRPSRPRKSLVGAATAVLALLISIGVWTWREWRLDPRPR